MYRTSHSPRILKGAESALFREGLGSLFDQTSDTIQVETGVEAFDGLSSEQKHVLLAQVGKALLYENVPAPTFDVADLNGDGTADNFDANHDGFVDAADKAI